MSKLSILVLLFAMLFSFSACGKDSDSSKSSSESSSAVDSAEESSEGSGSDIPSGTAGAVLSEEFHNQVKADASLSAQAVADAVLANSAVTFKGMTMPVEDGLLTGFGNTEIKGFKEGVMFGPAISSIPFIGYVFALDGESDADAFMNTLKGSADPRWNVCTEADRVIVEKEGDKVFFLMCPDSLEEE